ncbi:MAG: TonB-dependent receptor [Bryobacterales bacterium]|nr:TonB-dependent receptor [Bryobacteraceae bacterium]MDW8355300.1 TonB-dependent receptor [Bryobacterales bacterium]
MPLRIWVCAALIFLSAASVSSAQVLYGSIIGNVVDPSEAAVPGATITIVHKETGVTRTTTTDLSGLYHFPTVPSGTYDIRVTKEGFQTYVQSDVVVPINAVTRVNIALKVGAVTETVQVAATTAALQTDRAEVRAEVTASTLENLPVFTGRNYQHVFKMLPGFSQPRNAHSIPSNPSRSLMYEVNGTVPASNNVRLDGATQYNIWLPHITAYVPALESIEAVNVVTNSFDAEQGLAGGAAINVQIKSGTNEVHGSLFEYHNNNKIKARQFFSPAGERKPKYIFNQFGGTIGGPFVKNKFFYFASYEGTSLREFASRLMTVPTELTRRGIMTESDREIYDPLTGNPDGSGRVPFPGKIIPPSRFEPISLKLVENTPLPTFPGRFTSNYYAAGSFAFDRHTLDTKFNYNASEKFTTYWRYSYLNFDQLCARAFRTPLGEHGLWVSREFTNPGKGYGGTHSGTWAMTYVVSPTFVLDANIGVTVTIQNATQQQIDQKIGSDVLGIPGTNGPRRFEGGWPRFQISGYDTLGETEGYMPYYRWDPQHNYQANANWIKGAHEVRWGMEFSYQNLNHTQPEFYGGTQPGAGGFLFSGGITTVRGGPAANQWNSYADFLLGLPFSRGKIFQFPDQYNTRTSMYSLYVRDRWQVSRRVTFSYGTRWEYFPVPVRKGKFGLERYNLATNKMHVCGVGVVPRDCGVDVSARLFAPRLGLAIRATDTFVIRAGYGITNDPWNLARPMRVNHPVLMSLTENGPNSFTPVGRLRDGIPTLTQPPLGNGIIDMPLNVDANTLPDFFKRGYIQSWNFMLQKQFGSFTAQVGYVATRQNNILGFLEQNYGLPGGGRDSQQLYRRFLRTAATRLVGPVGNSRYDSLQATLERRFAGGYQLHVSYTWSKCMGIAGVNNSGDAPAIPIPEYFHLNRALCWNDSPHNFQTAAIAELPFGRGKRWVNDGAAAAVLGGWQVSAMFSSFSGYPFSVVASGVSLNAPFSSQRADLKPNCKPKKLGHVGAGLPFYDWTCFSSVTEPRFGTAGFNILRGPGLVNLDLGVFRRFDVSERVKLEFRAEAFNATNTPHFANPSNNISNLRLNPDGTFRSGVFEVTGVRNTGREGIDERVFRFGLRLSF